jgi:hypothetical protein
MTDLLLLTVTMVTNVTEARLGDERFRTNAYIERHVVSYLRQGVTNRATNDILQHLEVRRWKLIWTEVPTGVGPRADTESGSVTRGIMAASVKPGASDPTWLWPRRPAFTNGLNQIPYKRVGGSIQWSAPPGNYRTLVSDSGNEWFEQSWTTVLPAFCIDVATAAPTNAFCLVVSP